MQKYKKFAWNSQLHPYQIRCSFCVTYFITNVICEILFLGWGRWEKRGRPRRGQNRYRNRRWWKERCWKTWTALFEIPEPIERGRQCLSTKVQCLRKVSFYLHLFGLFWPFFTKSLCTRGQFFLVILFVFKTVWLIEKFFNMKFVTCCRIQWTVYL